MNTTDTGDNRTRGVTSEGAVPTGKGGRGGEGELSSGGLGALSIGNCDAIKAHRYTNRS